MLKYLIIPKWLYDAMCAENRNLIELLNFDNMLSLLSGVELSFYIRCNVANYRSFGSLFINPKLNLKLCNEMCKNCISIDVNFMNYMKDNDYLNNEKKPLLPHLIVNPIITLENGSRVHEPYDFKPLLVGTDTLGLIPTHGRAYINKKIFSLRRDIYDVMRKFMTVDDVIKSPLFGV